MIIKDRDATPHTIARLERRAGRAGDAALREACREAVARLRADPTTQRACDFIDARFGDADEWAVIHDLRLEAGGRPVQVNHVLIGDVLEVVVVDSRFIDCGLCPRGDGRCESFDGVERRLIASPLIKMAHDLRALGEAFERLDVPRERRRPAPCPTLRGCVLIDPGYRLGAAFGDARERVGVCSREALHPMLRNRRRRQTLGRAERISGEALERLSRDLAACHIPVFHPALLGEPSRRGAAPFAVRARGGTVDRLGERERAPLEAGETPD